jgi:hypothetical protein
MRVRILLLDALAGGLALALVIGIVGYYQLLRDCDREGCCYGSDVVGPGPEIDWSSPARRLALWGVLDLPDRLMVTGHPSEVREGAVQWLVHSAAPDDVPRVLDHVRRHHMSTRMGGVFLGLCWLSATPAKIEPAEQMLAGDELERALACFALPLLTGHRLDESTKDWIFPLFDSDPLDQQLSQVFGATASQLADEWSAWLAQHRDESVASMHREMILRALSVPYRGQALADSPALSLLWHLLGDDQCRAWRLAAQVPEASSAHDVCAWLKSVERSRQYEALRAAPPVALDREAMLTLHVFQWSWF